MEDVEELASIVIRPDSRGGSVRVGDVADVRDTFAPGKFSGRVNGEPAIVLTVRKEEQADSVLISKDVHSLVEGLRPTLPPGVTIDLFGDAAAEVQHSLGTLYANAIVGLLLVLLVLWVAVGARNATMAAIGLPVALLGRRRGRRDHHHREHLPTPGGGCAATKSGGHWYSGGLLASCRVHSD